MMVGLVLSIIAGSLVGLQNIFNNKVNEHAGTWATTTLVLGMGFSASFIMGLFFEGKAMFHLQHMETWFWFSGIIGVGVVTCLVQGIKRLGATYAILIALTAQLLIALLWDSLGWLGLAAIPFTWKQLVGVLVIISGIFIFKLGGKQEEKELSPDGMI